MGEPLDLDALLIAAHEGSDISQLIRLYGDAADKAEQAGDMDKAAFFRTHAMVFALEAGDPVATTLRARLAAQGRA